MQTHEDREHQQRNRDWMESLKRKAERMTKEGAAEIAGGAVGERVLEEWRSNGVAVRKMPDDEHGLLRISIGGGPTPAPVNYCVFRGDHGRCVDLLRKALVALETPRVK